MEKVIKQEKDAKHALPGKRNAETKRKTSDGSGVYYVQQKGEGVPMKRVMMVCMMAILVFACIGMTSAGTASAKKAETVMGVYVDAVLGDADAAERLLTLE